MSDNGHMLTAAIYSVFAIELATRSAHAWDAHDVTRGIVLVVLAMPMAYLAIRNGFLAANPQPNSPTSPTDRPGDQTP
jgi:Na+-transporting NADH:ubiquinone oxidoreductase subunit NqrB